MPTYSVAVFLLAVSVIAFGADSKPESHWEGEATVCGACHEAITKQFRPTAHGKTMEFAAGPHALTCGTCHAGDLQKHIETADPATVVNQAKQKPEVVAESCLTCHVTDKHMMMWRGSQHESAGIGCLSCHSMHKPSEGKMMARKTQTETCGSCHASERNAMLKRSTHLFRDERGSVRIQCASCHNPHGSQAEKLISANSVNEKCYSCHQEKRGPFLWEHSPVRENCINCHSPHGSNNERLLAMRRPQLCQSCHAQQRHQTMVGRPNVMFNINRSCSNCHALIHGSNHPSGANFNQ